MRKITLLTLLGMSILFGINTYSQSSRDLIPDVVKEKAAEYLKRAGTNCPGEPIVEKIGEKLEDRAVEDKYVKDGIKDKIILYHIKNKCDWINVPNYIRYTLKGLGNGKFVEIGYLDYIISKDKETWEEIPLKEKW